MVTCRTLILLTLVLAAICLSSCADRVADPPHYTLEQAIDIADGMLFDGNVRGQNMLPLYERGQFEEWLQDHAQIEVRDAVGRRALPFLSDQVEPALVHNALSLILCTYGDGGGVVDGLLAHMQSDDGAILQRRAFLYQLVAFKDYPDILYVSPRVMAIRLRCLYSELMVDKMAHELIKNPLADRRPLEERPDDYAKMAPRLTDVVSIGLMEGSPSALPQSQWLGERWMPINGKPNGRLLYHYPTLEQTRSWFEGNRDAILMHWKSRYVAGLQAGQAYYRDKQSSGPHVNRLEELLRAAEKMSLAEYAAGGAK